jgi:quercetin dioxygenase-like cupin family protein
MYMNRKLVAIAVTILLAAIGVTTALATPALGTIAANLFARGTFVQPVFAYSDGIALITDETTDHAVQEITFGPGSSSGWHTHPGVVLVTVKSGTLTRYHSDCSSDTVSAGQTFFETGGITAGFLDRGLSLGGHAGVVRNEGTVPVVVYVTYIVPTGAPLRIDRPNPGCAVN